MLVEFSTQSSRNGLNPAAHTDRLVNFYREPLMAGASAQYQLRAVLGMQAFAETGRVFMRQMMVYGAALHVICGGRLSRVTGSVADLGEVVDSPETSVAENTGILTIAAGGAYYTWDGSVLASPETGAVEDVGSVCHLGSYTIVTQRGGRIIQWSKLADPDDFDGLDFASAETTAEPIIRAVVWRDVLLVLKGRSLEQWARTGLAGPDAFRRIQGGDMEIGLHSYGLVTSFPNGLAFVGSDGRVYVWGGSPKPISTPPVEEALTESQPQRMFFYERRGHGFICLTFRNAPAWCYDIATGEWHERAENDGPWSATCTVLHGDQWFAGSDNGRVSKLTTRCEDFGRPMVRRAISAPVRRGQPFTVALLELFPRKGQDRQSDGGIVLDDGSAMLADSQIHPLGDGGAEDGPADISIRVSRDGVTFGPEKARPFGETAQYARKITWRNLGQFRGVAAFEARLSTIVDVPLLSAAEVTIR